MDKSGVKEAIHEALEERGISFKTHLTHHRFVEDLIEEHRIRKERREKVKTSVMGWMAISCLTFLAVVGSRFWEQIAKLFHFGGK